MLRLTQRFIFALISGLLLLGGHGAAQSSTSSPSMCPVALAPTASPGGPLPAESIPVATSSVSTPDAVGKQRGFLLSGEQFFNVDVPGALAGITGTLPTVCQR